MANVERALYDRPPRYDSAVCPNNPHSSGDGGGDVPRSPLQKFNPLEEDHGEAALNDQEVFSKSDEVTEEIQESHIPRSL